jgi:hypothetical protein
MIEPSRFHPGHEPTDDDVVTLRQKIENFKRTREWSKGSVREWCNRLIASAEDELRRMGALPMPVEHLPRGRSIEKLTKSNDPL